MTSPLTVIFDLDGTLVDSLPGLTIAINRALADVGRPPVVDEQVRLMIGEGAPTLIQRALEATGGPLAEGPDRTLAVFLAHYDVDAPRYTSLFDGARAMLDSLRDRGARLGLCTNKPQRPTEVVLDALGLGSAFGAVIGGDVLDVRKPDPGHVLAVIEALGGEHERAVLVGDSPADARAGRAAEVPVVLLRHGYSRVPVDDLGADLVVDNLHGVEQAVRTLVPA